MFADKFYDREEARRTIIPEPEVDPYEDGKTETKDIDTGIIESLLPSYQKRGSLLLHRIKDIGVSWDNQGVLKINGTPIEGSNLKELVHYVLRHRRRNVPLPIGIKQFKDILTKTNLSKYLWVI